MFRFSRQTSFLITTILVLVAGVFLSVSPVFAQSTDAFGVTEVGDGLVLGDTPLLDIVKNIINIFFGLLGIIVVGIVLYGGFLYMTSGGSEEKISQAKKLLINGTIGLVIILSSFAIASFIIKSLSDATGAGTGSGSGSGSEGGVYGSNPCVPGTGFNQDQCDKDVCAKFPNSYTCLSKNFFVRSITPSTPSGGTGMNNIVLRTVLSQPIPTGALGTALVLKKGSTEYPLSLSFANDEKTIVQATIKNGESCAAVSPAQGTWTEVVGSNASTNSLNHTQNPLRISYPSGLATDVVNEIKGEPVTMEIALRLDAPYPDGMGVLPVVRYVNGNQSGTAVFGFQYFARGEKFCFVADYASGKNDSQYADACHSLAPNKFEPGKEYRYLLVWANGIATLYSKDGKLGSDTLQTLPVAAGDLSIGGKSTQPYTLTVFRVLKQSMTETEAVQYLSGAIQTTDGQCIPGDPSDYQIAVNKELKSASDKTLLTTVNGVSYPLSATFKVDVTKQIDKTAPTIGQITLNNQTNGFFISGKPYTLKSVVNDRSVVQYGGVSYVVYTIKNKQSGKMVLANAVVAPLVSDGSSNAFNAELQDIAWGNEFVPQETYVVTIEAHDIDNNVATASAEFMAVGANCDEFGNPTDPKYANECLVKGAACSSDTQCSKDARCAKPDYSLCSGATGCTCKDWPTITGVDPLNGAEGNWVTISGLHFDLLNPNSETGKKISFAVDANTDGALDQTEEATWIDATLAECGTDVWHDTWIVAEVPGSGLPLNSKSAIRVSVSDGTKTLTDHTLDAHYNKIGTFEKNTTKRPKLCSVETIGGETAAIPGTAVNAFGQFGNATGKIFFGSIQGALGSGAWTDTLIKSTVPVIDFGNKISSVVGVKVEAGGEQSNGVPFEIKKDASTVQPEIFSIQPAETTRGSFVTIQGKNFGTSGHVYLGKTQATALECAKGKNLQNCLEMKLPTVEGCTNSWTDTQIIVEVPQTAEFIGYKLALVNNTQYTTDGSHDFKVRDGLPKPSVCAVTPMSTQSPIIKAPYFDIRGKNFTGASSVYFWTKGSVGDNLSSWIMVNNDNFQEDGMVPPGMPSDDESFQVLAQGTEIKTYAPVKNGYSLLSGPVVVRSGAEVSNPWTVTVVSCTQATASVRKTYEDAGYQCCAEGPDSGRWKHASGGVCEGQTREAGYMWRFRSGVFPRIPKVAEQCDVAGWDTSTKAPSPSPAIGLPLIEGYPTGTPRWPQGDNACVNAAIHIAFEYTGGTTDALMDVETIKKGITVATCDNVKGLDCEGRKVDPNVEFDTSKNGGSNVEIVPDSGDKWKPNQWYRVEVSDTVSSKAYIDAASNLPVNAAKIEKTRSCGKGTAYCFVFKTGAADQLCTMKSAFVLPPEYTTTLLGTVHKPVMSTSTLVYGLLGKADKVCTVMNVDALDWGWESKNDQKAKIVPLLNTKTGKNSKATATALASDPFGTQFVATWLDNPQKATNPITGTSTLYINLGDPKVIYWEPNCLESCINTTIGVGFNQFIAHETITPGSVTVEMCEDSDCLKIPNDPENVQFIIEDNKVKGSDLYPTYVTILLQPIGSKFDVNTYYKVSLTADIKGKEQLNESTTTGKPLQPFSWVFKTNASGNVCSVDAVDVIPVEHISSLVGEKVVYTAEPRTNANECSKYGQVLNKWEYGYDWSTQNPQVASITKFPKTTSWAPYCTPQCLPAGSDIAKGQTIPSLCGNNVPEPGEQCEIGSGCSTSCLRTGNTQVGETPTSTYAGICGNGLIEIELGEACDPNHPDYIKTGGCTATCKKTGSKTTPNLGADGQAIGGYCGDGFVGLDEDCDIAKPDEAPYCTAQCLWKGTKLSQTWCDAGNMDKPECASAVSVCGNGKLEGGESCEIGVNGATDSECSDWCVFRSIANLCNKPQLKQCDAGQPGCTQTTCQLTGSSLLYTTPSICGDGTKGTGEPNIGSSISCEGVTAPASTKQNPTQLATIVGNGTNNTTSIKNVFGDFIFGQQTTVKTTVSTSTISKSGAGELVLQCGYTEYDEPKGVAGGAVYNNCTSNTDNTYGVASNSCCVPRTIRKEVYPEHEAVGVCRNSYIEVSFPGEMDSKSVTTGNIQLLVGSSDSDYCTKHQLQSAGSDMGDLLAFNSDEEPRGFWGGIWRTIKSYVLYFFSGDVLASSAPSGVETWCVARTTVTPDVYYAKNGNTVTETRIGLYISDVMEPHTTYGILLRGGKKGIKTTNGVGIKNSDQALINDFWSFTTGPDICKIKSVAVEPNSALFKTPNTTSTFQITLISTNNNQLIAATPGYMWDYDWQPQGHPIFAIPAPATAPTNTISIDIGSKELEGSLLAEGRVTVTNDIYQGNNQKGKTFIGNIDLRAFFCQAPWPDNAKAFPFTDNVRVKSLYEDGEFGGVKPLPMPYTNIGFYYCRDAGEPSSFADDLPFLVPAVISSSTVSNDTVKKILFTTEDTYNSDAIGLQVFKNPARLTAKQWFDKEFPNAEVQPQQISIDGYDAVTDGNNYYVNALNVTENANDVKSAFSNIYLFSINKNAEESTRQVLQKIVSTLKFNVNVKETGKCQNVDGTTKSAIECSSDLDCVGKSVSNAGTITDTAYCSDNKAQLQRDWIRVRDIEAAQAKLDVYYATNKLDSNFKADLKSGSFLANYTNSKWPSWGYLGSVVGALPSDPINQWNACSGGDTGADSFTCWNAAGSTFQCPAVAQMYEYTFNTSTGNSYVFHAPFEYFSESEVQSNFIAVSPDKNTIQHIDNDTWSNERTCTGQAVSAAVGQCGDGVKNVNEACDPGGFVPTVEVCSVGTGTDNGVRVNSCSSSCTLITGACQAKEVCGNGIIEGGEICDDGVDNGKYGKCDAPSGVSYVGQCKFTRDVCTGTVAQAGVGNCPNTKKLSEIGSSDWYCYGRNGNKTEQCFRGDGELACTDGDEFCAPDDSKYETRTLQKYCFEVDGERMVNKGKTCNSNSDCPSNTSSRQGSQVSMVCSFDITDTQVGLNYRGGNTCQAENNAVLGCRTIGFQGGKCGDFVKNGNNEYCENTDIQLVSRTFGSIASLVDLNSISATYSELLQKSLFLCKSAGDDCVKKLDLLSTLYTTYGANSTDYRCKNDPRIVCSTNDATSCNVPTKTGVKPYNMIGNINKQFLTVTMYDKSDSANYFSAYENKGPCVQLTAGASYALYEKNSCSWDCQTKGSYCGDGKLDVSGGEQCDDGNVGNTDGCNQFCQKENLQCIKEAFEVSDFDANGIDLTKVKIQDGFANKKQACVSKTNGNQICAALGKICYGAEYATSTNPPTLSVQEGELCNSDITKDDITTFANPNATNKNVSILCVGAYTASQPQTPTGPALSCGNNTVDPGEACDLGAAKNGIACNPEYGKSCTYCAADCKSVLTVDAKEYCGDGKFQPAYETCEVTGTNGTIESNSFEALCKADGSGFKSDVFLSGSCTLGTKQVSINSCSDKGSVSCSECKAVVNNCVKCGQKDPGGAKANLGIINPLIGKNVTWPSGFTPRLWFWYQQPNKSWDTFVTGVNINSSNSGPTKQVSSDKNIESNIQCTDSYAYSVTDVLGGDKSNDNFLKKLNEEKKIFPYSVSGQATLVQNPFVLVPAVGDKNFRVVVRAPLDAGMLVGGFLGQKNTTPILERYTNYLSTGFCGSMGHESIYDYWNVGGCPTGWTNSVFYPHARIATSDAYNTQVQAWSVTFDDTPSDGLQLGFYVQSVDGNPLATYKNKDITVEVYEHHNGQAYSDIFGPTKVFKIKGAIGTSSSQNAKYWHVFNVKKVDGTYQFETLNNVQFAGSAVGTADGSIETCECAVKENILNVQKCTTQDLYACQ